MGLGMQTEQSCCGMALLAVGIIGLMTAKEGQTDVSNMEGYQMIAELTDFMLRFMERSTASSCKSWRSWG